MSMKKLRRRKMAGRPAPESTQLSNSRISRKLNTQAQPPAAGGQPLPAFLQHQSFFGALHPATQLAKPSAQLYGSAGGAGTMGATGIGTGIGGTVGGHPTWWCVQHHDFLSDFHMAGVS